jgi:hypothetical protein
MHKCSVSIVMPIAMYRCNKTKNKYFQFLCSRFFAGGIFLRVAVVSHGSSQIRD